MKYYLKKIPFLVCSPLVISSSRVWVAGIRNRSWATGLPSVFSSLGSGGNLADNFRTRASRILSAFSFWRFSSASFACLSASSFSRAACFSWSAWNHVWRNDNKENFFILSWTTWISPWGTPGKLDLVHVWRHLVQLVRLPHESPLIIEQCTVHVFAKVATSAHLASYFRELSVIMKNVGMSKIEQYLLNKHSLEWRHSSFFLIYDSLIEKPKSEILQNRIAEERSSLGF